MYLEKLKNEGIFKLYLTLIPDLCKTIRRIETIYFTKSHSIIS